MIKKMPFISIILTLLPDFKSLGPSKKKFNSLFLEFRVLELFLKKREIKIAKHLEKDAIFKKK